MANLKEIKRNIKSVQSTQKTTRAMKLVSAAKLKRAEEAAKRSRTYAVKLNEMLHEMSAKINKFKVGGSSSKFFNEVENPKVVDILFVTADKGLCGGFNIQTIKRVNALVAEYKEKGANVRLRGVGRKGVDFFTYQGIDLLEKDIGVSSSPTYEKAQGVITKAVDDFVAGECDKIILVHNGYQNMITQEVRQNNLIPVDIEVEESADTSASMMEIEAEDEEKMLEELVKKYFEYNMYYALIDSLAAEHSARMQAMDAATKNAKEKVEKLTVKYNKARQESITTELIEIISGMEALK
ncbi:MAG TPA: F0F1 ATP synthase subunit gamma [Campylobacterales bacterium]|nr:F0F1 ATP synthase subunit gamma [Campylobacterales bacterium]